LALRRIDRHAARDSVWKQTLGLYKTPGNIPAVCHTAQHNHPMRHFGGTGALIIRQRVPSTGKR
jgi:hypothetical protein